MFFRRLNGLLLSLGDGAIFTIAIFLVLLLGWLDYVTGFEISFSFFYLFPISLATWYIGIRSGYFITTTGLFIWLISNWMAGQQYTGEWIRFFNFGVRLIVFFLIAYLIDNLKTALKIERASARIDYLTGIFNRREFIEKLRSEIEQSSRMKYPVSLAFMDLDNFKKVNDDAGHNAGDELLRLISRTISKVIRKTDLFARLGGDEFGLFLPNVGQQEAKLIIEKIDQAVLMELNALQSPVTLSIGVITFNSLTPNADEMIRQADALMYQAKQTGKHRMVYFEME